MIKIIENKLKFHVEKFILKGARNQLLFIGTVVILISFISGFIHYLFYPETSLPEAIWWAFLRLSDPGYLGDDLGVMKRILSTLVTILGYVVFLGSLVAIMTQWLNSTIRRLELGLTPITRKGHIVILGWTNRTPIIIKEILMSEEQVNFFLKRIKGSKLHIVVLSEIVNPVIVHELAIELGPLWDEHLITFRSGSPLKIDHLERVDFIHAGVLIIPGHNIHYNESTKIETAIIKILMSISRYAGEKKFPCPYCVTEITDPEKISVIRPSYAGELEIISSNEIISRLIAQNVRTIGLSSVYSELLKNEDNELYLYDAHQYVGETFVNLRTAFSRSILIGIMRNKRGNAIPLINPPVNTTIRKGDQLIVLSKNAKTAIPDQFVQKNNAINDVHIEKNIEKKRKSLTKHVLIVGWNSKIPSLLHEFDNLINDNMKIDIYSIVSIEERMNYIEQFDFAYKRIKVNHISGNATVMFEFKKLNIHYYNTIIMVANDWLATGEDSDARTIMAYMFLKRLIEKHKTKPHFIVEILDPDNSMLFDRTECEVLISPHIISYTLGQVALRRGLRVLFDDLFSAGGTDILFEDVSQYGLHNKELTFDEIELEVYAHGDMAIGLRMGKDELNSDCILNPEKDKLWVINPEDQIIILRKY